MENDISGSVFLEELTLKYFPELVESLKKDIPRSLMMLGCLEQMNESPEVTSGHVYVSHWPNPDLVMFENMAYKALTDYNIPPSVIFASCSTEKLKMTLEKSHLSRFTSSPEILVGDLRCFEIGNEITKSKGNGLQVTLESLPYFATATDVTKLEKHECPPGYFIAPLRLQDAVLIDTMWKFGGNPNSLKRFKNLISHSLTAGVYYQDTDQLVSWGLIAEYGCISMLHTLECHRRRGLAMAIVYHLTKILLDRRRTVFCIIEEENETPDNFFVKWDLKFFRVIT
ncbi:uncharacterized protein [Pocillopora verrucosa]|uniref:uncharacterized protein n=1 Tax=Pocillopora verrucosa TaxID=203993 RepID=UPI00333FB725